MSRPRPLPDHALHARVRAIHEARERAFEELHEANDRGPTGDDIQTFTDAMRACESAMAEAIASTGRIGVKYLFLNDDGSVTAWYGSRFREVSGPLAVPA
jgi:hypothetical protein